MAKRQSQPNHDDIVPTSCTLERRLEILSFVPLFKRLEPSEIADVNRRFAARSYQAGEAIYHQGDATSNLHVVATGAVKLLRYSAGGQEVLLDILAPGEFFGSLMALGDTAYRDAATAAAPSCVLLMSALVFEEVMEAFPAVTRAALELTASRLRDSRDAVQRLSALPVEQRLAAILLRLAEKFGEMQEGGLCLQLPLSQQDLAAMAGTTVETVSRTLRHFRALGLVLSGRRWLVVVAPARLAELAAKS